MSDDHLIYQASNGVATLTLNRPHSYNALNLPLLHDLRAALDRIAADDSVRAVVITGSGKGFCSGADLTAIGGVGIDEAVRDGLNPLVLAMRRLEKPIVCAINGVAAGAGTGLALAADFRLASDRASFVFAAFAGIGLVPDSGVTYLLQQVVGQAKTFELCLLAGAKERLDANSAQALGIVNHVVEHDDLLAQAHALAAQLAQMPTRAIGYTKRALYSAPGRTLEDALEFEAQMQAAAVQTEDFQEGLAAFLEKRQPVFSGK